MGRELTDADEASGATRWAVALSASARSARGGRHSPWISRQRKEDGFEGIVANPRRVRLIAESDSKSDRLDAEQWAPLGRIDPGLLYPIVDRGERAQRDRLLSLTRDRPS